MAPSSLTVHELGSVQALEALAPDWRALAARLPDGSPYLTPEFMIPWARMLAGRYRLCLLAVSDGERLVGLAPLFERRLSKWGVGFITRSFPLYGLSPPFDLLVDPDRPQAVEALLKHLRTHRHWHLVELLNVPAASPNVALLRAACARQGLDFEAQPALSTTHVRVNGDWATYLASRPRHLRKTLRQGLRRLEQAGPVRFVRCPQDGLALQTGMDMALSVIARSWKRFDEESVDWPAFFHEMGACMAAQGMLCLRFLMVGDEAVAYQLEIRHRGDWHGLHNAYDLASSDGAPGALLLAHALEDAHVQVAGCFDFMGTKDYLERWALGHSHHVRLRVSRPGWVSRLKLALYDRVATARKARAQLEEEARRAKRLGRESAADDGDDIDGPAAP